MKELWKKVFKILGIGIGLYVLLIASLYIFPLSSLRVKDVVDVNWLFLGPREHLILSTPIDEKPIKYEQDNEIMIGWSADRHYCMSGITYNDDAVLVDGYKYFFKFDENWRYNIIYYNAVPC